MRQHPKRISGPVPWAVAHPTEPSPILPWEGGLQVPPSQGLPGTFPSLPQPSPTFPGRSPCKSFAFGPSLGRPRGRRGRPWGKTTCEVGKTGKALG